MTTLQPKLTDELLLTGTPHSQPSNSGGNIYKFEVRAPIPYKIPNTISIDSLVSEFETDPDMALHLALSRKQIADDVYKAKEGTLTFLRLKAGLSQAKLAEKIGTSQPYIAKIEAGKNDPSTDMIGKIANALNVEPQNVFSVIYNQIKNRD